MKRRHGFVYTLFTIVLVGSIIALVSFQTTPSTNFRVAEKVKTDEMTYFLKGLTEDLERTTEISGKRAVISIIDKEILNGTYLQHVNESIKTAMIEGVYNGTPLSLTANNTLEDWEYNMNSLAEKRGTNAIIDFTQITILPSSPFTLRAKSMAETTVRDDILEVSITRNMSSERILDITGLEDPLNTIESNTYISQRFVECPMYEGVNSSGDWFSGIALITDQTNLSLESGSGKIAVIEDPTSVVDAGNFEGYITEEDPPISNVAIFSGKKYVAGMTNAQQLILDNSFVTVYEDNVWNTNITETDEIHTCYFIAPQGPSFLDRLEGNFSTSEKYATEVDEEIGIASYIYIGDMPPEMQYGSSNYRLDYEYWKNFP